MVVQWRGFTSLMWTGKQQTKRRIGSSCLVNGLEFWGGWVDDDDDNDDDVKFVKF